MLAILPALLYISPSSAQDEFSDRFKPPVESGILEGYQLSEASGLVASTKNKGCYWVINDSGNAPTLFLINELGKTAALWKVNGCDNVDWEDIAIFSEGTNNEPTVLIADIGDNFAVRDHIRLLSITEPEMGEEADTVLDNVKVYSFRYEDGARDAETLLVDPSTNAVYVITKREEQVRLYKAPDRWSEADTMTLAFQASLPYRWLTAGDISIDGTEILLKSYNQVYYWKRNAAESLAETLAREPELLKYNPEPQGESIAWKLDGTGFFTLSEKSYAPNQSLYFYERNTKK